MSTQEYVVTGSVQGGKLLLRNRQKLEAAIARWKDCEVTVAIEKVQATRSLEQNALYWIAYVKPLSEFTGYEPRWIHAYLKKRFLPAKHLLIQDKNGVIVDEADLEQLTTTRMNKIEFGEYLSAIEPWAAELGVQVGTNKEGAA